jgi:amidase
MDGALLICMISRRFSGEPRQMTVSPALSLALLAAALLAGPAAAGPEEKSIAELKAELASGAVTSVDLVKAYEARIAELNPRLHAVIMVNPQALADAAASDAARAAGRPLGPLAGVPILLKDNIESKDPMPTTAGSLALKDNVTGRDAPLVAGLRAAGAVILGKTNLSEWANIRSSSSISGWSAVGGLTHNPYALDRNACGSSSGSGAAAAASLAAAAVGTETDGSVTCPASINGLVGLKPTVGLVSRTHVVPISHTQDTAGPMARSVADAAILLNAMAGSDPLDPATALADAKKTDYLAGLTPDGLKGVRIGVLRFADIRQEATRAVYQRALDTLKAQGAVLVEIASPPPGAAALGALEGAVMFADLKTDLEAYLATTDPAKVKTRTIADLIAFDTAHADLEMPLFGQEGFKTAAVARSLNDPVYLKAAADAHRLAGPEGIDALLSANAVAVLVAPTVGPAWITDPVLKDHFVGEGHAGSLAAVAGYPHLTVPMGLVSGLPVGLSFIGPAWSEAALLKYGYAFEQAAHARTPPTLRPTVPVTADAPAP